MTRRTMTLLSLTGGLAVLVVGLWKTPSAKPARQESAGSPASPRDSAFNASLNHRISSLERRLEVLHSQIPVAPAQGSAGGPDGSGGGVEPTGRSPDDEEPLAVEEQNAIAKERVHQTMSEALSEQYDNEQWTRDTHDAVSDLLGASIEMQGTQVDDVTCRETLCRIELAHDANEDFELFRDRGFRVFQGNLFFDYNDETGHSVIYVAKAGLPLPGQEE